MKIDWQKVKNEAVAYLSELIQIDTSNPPGNEMKAIRFLDKIAKKNGLFTKIYETDSNRGNIIISLNEEFNNPIVLLSHVDVVPAIAEDWEIPPFSGKVIDNELWGRGAIDAKQLTITHLMTLILLKRKKLDLKKDIVLVATADEENGSKFGLLSLLEEKSDIFQDAVVFNEGGGFPIMIEDTSYYLVEMGQKGTATIRFTFPEKKSPNPYMPNNKSIEQSLLLVDRLLTYAFVEDIPEITSSMFETIAIDLGKDLHVNSIRSFLQMIPDHLVPMFESMTKTTFAMTKWRAGRKLKNNNELYVDSRPLPSVTKEKLQEYLTVLTKGIEVDYEIMSFSQGFETPLDDEMLHLFESCLAKEVKSAKVIPFITVGSNDARHLIPYQSKVFGYCPMLPDMTFDKVIKMVHGVNEKIPIESLRFGIENMFHILVSVGRENSL